MTRVALLHGAYGAPQDWDGAVAASGTDARLLHLPDGGAIPESIEVNEVWEHVVDALVEQVAQLPPGPVVVGGYSLGARLALAVALRPAVRPRLRGLLLVAGTAGLEDPAARARRAVVDDERAAWLARDPRAFLDDFWTLPLFAGLADHPGRRALLDDRIARASASPAGLARLMRGLSVGRMTPLWAALPSLRVPVVVVNGARDADYVATGHRLVSALPDARAVVIEGAGHALLLEAPSAVGAALSDLVASSLSESP